MVWINKSITPYFSFLATCKIVENGNKSKDYFLVSLASNTNNNSIVPSLNYFFTKFAIFSFKQLKLLIGHRGNNTRICPFILHIWYNFYTICNKFIARQIVFYSLFIRQYNYYFLFAIKSKERWVYFSKETPGYDSV